MLKTPSETAYRYCILPSGNQSEFPELDAELARRNVGWSYLEFIGGRIYRIPVADVEKLPWDVEYKERYLGDDDSGHKIYPMSEAAIATFARRLDKIEWKTGRSS